MNLRDAKSEALALIESGNAVLMVSPSGIGKSQTMRKIFEYLRDRDAPLGIRWGFGTIFAATQTPPDFIGYQFKGEKVIELPDGSKRTVTVTDPSIPLWYISDEGLPAFMYDKFFLVIDEYGQGEPDVKRACAEIMLNGGTSPWYLPAGSARVACTNEGARYGVTKDFDFCIARRSLLRIAFDARIWADDFADKEYIYQGRKWATSPTIKAWAMANPQVACESEPAIQGPWCNPRSLCSLDRYLQVKSAKNGGKVEFDSPTIETAAGTVGMGATMSISSWYTFKLELPTYDTVIADPDNCPLPTKPDMLMLMAYELAGLTQAADLGPAIRYVQRMPKDMAVTYISSLMRRDYRNMANQPAMQAWVSKNSSLIALLQSLAA